MLRVTLAGVRLAIQCFDTHSLHQRGGISSTHREALAVKQATQHSATNKWILQTQFVDATHQPKIHLRDRRACVVRTGTRNAEQLALATDGEIMILLSAN